MIMSEERKEQYKTLIILCTGFALIGWRWHLKYSIISAGVVLISGLVSVFLLRKITWAWMWIGEKIGAVMSRVVLGMVFVFFLTPVALIYRALGSKNKNNKKDTYFVDRSHTYTPADLEKIF
jgi:hypothetical protein